MTASGGSAPDQEEPRWLWRCVPGVLWQALPELDTRRPSGRGDSTGTVRNCWTYTAAACCSPLTLASKAANLSVVSGRTR